MDALIPNELAFCIASSNYLYSSLLGGYCYMIVTEKRRWSRDAIQSDVLGSGIGMLHLFHMPSNLKQTNR